MSSRTPKTETKRGQKRRMLDQPDKITMLSTTRLWQQSKVKAFSYMLQESVQLGYSIPQAMHDENARLVRALAVTAVTAAVR